MLPENINFWNDRWIEIVLPYPLTGFYFSWIGIGCLYFTSNKFFQIALCLCILINQSLAAIFAAILVMLWRYRSFVSFFGSISVVLVGCALLSILAVERRVDTSQFRCVDRWVMIEMGLHNLRVAGFGEFILGGVDSIDPTPFLVSTTCDNLSYLGAYSTAERHSANKCYKDGNIPVSWLHNDLLRIYFSSGILGLFLLGVGLYVSAIKGFYLYPIAFAASLLNPFIFTIFSVIIFIFLLLFLLFRISDD